MCLCIHTYIHTCMHACIHTYIHAYMYIYIYVQIYVHKRQLLGYSFRVELDFGVPGSPATHLSLGLAAGASSPACSSLAAGG